MNLEYDVISRRFPDLLEEIEDSDKTLEQKIEDFNNLIESRKDNIDDILLHVEALHSFTFEDEIIKKMRRNSFDIPYTKVKKYISNFKRKLENEK